MWSPDLGYYYAYCHYQIVIIWLLASFSRQFYLIVFHWNLNDRKSPQVSRTLQSILADQNKVSLANFRFLHSHFQAFGNASKSASNKSCHFHVPQLFFSFLEKSKYFFHLFVLFYFSSLAHRNGKIHWMANSFILDNN